MEITKSGNIAITINPERHYHGQFVGKEFYLIADVKKAFPEIEDFAEIDGEKYDLGVFTSNAGMIRHYVRPFRSVGYICE